MTGIVQVNEIQNSAGTTILAKIENGVLTGVLSPATGFRNRIINGDMRIDQRNNGASVTANSTTPAFPVDRWFGRSPNSLGVFTLQRSTDAPIGFNNSVVCTVTTAAAVGASDLYFFQHRIEGSNVADLQQGTINSSPFAVSFFAKSSITGNFGASVGNNVDQSNPFTFTINAANTWEYKTVYVPGSVTGTWNTESGTGLIISFSLGTGSSLTGTADVWANYPFAPTGSNNLITVSGATLQITGVQLEKGTVATPFEFRSIGQELGLCQRYAYVPAQSPGFALAFVTGAGAFQGGQLTHPQTMRASPTISNVTGFTIQGVTATAIGFSYSATATYLSLGGNNSNGQGDGVLRSVNGNQIPLISAEL